MLAETDLSHCMNTAVAFAEILTPFLASLAFVVTIMLAARSKQADILIECHRRHAELVSALFQLRRVEPDSEANTVTVERYKVRIAEWFGSFWRQQDDQFSHWQSGFIDDCTYIEWNKTRLRALETGNNGTPYLGTLTYREGFDVAAPDWCSQRFQSFVVRLWVTKDARQVVREFRPTGFRVTIIRLLCNTTLLDGSDCVPL